MLGLLAVVISLMLIGNVYISARLRDAELALCRVLGMARGDLLAIEVLSLVLLTGFALAVGLSTAQGLINLLAAQFKAQAQLLAGLPEAGVSRMTGELFMPVTAVAGPIIAITLGLVVLSIIWPSLRVANTDPAKVFTRS
jgi:ABC-type antimicrobial peptide transport system permease subunit